jgi:hypothetical protein
MVTLTYRDGDDWQPRHVSDLLKNIRQWAGRRSVEVAYVWVGELTKRGRLHYHVLLWLPRGVTLPKPDKQGWWRHGSTRIEWARKPVGYLVKYASKGTGEDWDFPAGARIHGAGGLDAAERMQRRWWVAPQWVRTTWPEWEADTVPAKGGGWVARSTGDWQPSPWEVIGFDGLHVHIRRRATSEGQGHA